VQELVITQGVLGVDLGGEVGVWCLIGEGEGILMLVEIGWRESRRDGGGKAGRGYCVGSFEA
jgi:hypothetical protein